jgi:hypothetical protein
MSIENDWMNMYPQAKKKEEPKETKLNEKLEAVSDVERIEKRDLKERWDKILREVSRANTAIEKAVKENYPIGIIKNDFGGAIKRMIENFDKEISYSDNIPEKIKNSPEYQNYIEDIKALKENLAILHRDLVSGVFAKASEVEGQYLFKNLLLIAFQKQ